MGLNAEQIKSIEIKSGGRPPPEDLWGAFIVARAKYIVDQHLAGKSDQEIAREVGVNFTDNGLHVRQIREAVGF